jgi:hypothetical protein
VNFGKKYFFAIYTPYSPFSKVFIIIRPAFLHLWLVFSAWRMLTEGARLLTSLFWSFARLVLCFPTNLGAFGCWLLKVSRIKEARSLAIP